MQVQSLSTQNRLFHLRREFRPQQRGAGGLLEVTPWIDVVLLLILFIIMQSATLKKPGLQVNLPSARATSGARYDAFVLTVPQEGIYYFSDERLPWVVLSERLGQAAIENPNKELIIEADETLSYRSLTTIYNLAVEAGWKHVFLATRLDRASRPLP